MMLNKELLPFVAQIRHEFTNYDKLCCYYANFREERAKLNKIISDLVGGVIDIPEFHKRVKIVEDSVDLTKKRNQKKYIKKQKFMLRKVKYYTENQIHEISKKNLQNILNFQKAMDNGTYRPELSNNELIETYRWKR